MAFALFFQHHPNEKRKPVIKWHKKNIQEAKKIIGNGNKIISSYDEKTEYALNIINQNIKKYKNQTLLPRSYHIEIYLLKAQLLYKLGQLKNAEKTYQEVINLYQERTVYIKEELTMFAQAHIGLANLECQKISYIDDIDNSTKKHVTKNTNYKAQTNKAVEKCQQHIKNAMTMLSNNYEKTIILMNKYEWLNIEPQTIVNGILDETPKNNKFLSLLRKIF